MNRKRLVFAFAMLATLLCFRSGIAQESSQLAGAQDAAEKVLDGTDGDLSKDHLFNVQQRLQQALQPFMVAKAKGPKSSAENIAADQFLLGRLAMFLGQQGEADRLLSISDRRLPLISSNEALRLQIQRARAATLLLSGRFPEAKAAADRIPKCATNQPCVDGYLLGQCLMSVHSRLPRDVDVSDWNFSVFRLGPFGPCASDAFGYAATAFASQSRFDMVEPLLRAALQASYDHRSELPVPIGYGWEERAAIELVNYLQAAGRYAEAKTVLAEARADPFLHKPEQRDRLQFLSSITVVIPKPDPLAPPPHPQIEAALLENNEVIARVLREHPQEFIPGGFQAAESEKLARAEESSAELKSQKSEWQDALEFSDSALFAATRFIFPNLPLRQDMGIASAECPAALQRTSKCKQWNEDIIDAYASPFLSRIFAQRAVIEDALGHEAEAIKVDGFSRRIMNNWFARNWDSVDSAKHEIESQRPIYIARLTFLARLYKGGGPLAEKAMEEGFEIAQYLQMNHVSLSVRQSVARANLKRPEARALLQQRQIAAQRLNQVPTPNSQERSDLLRQIADTDAKLPFSAADLERRASFQSIPQTRAATLLDPFESMVIILPLPDSIDVFAVTPKGSIWVRSNHGEEWLRGRVVRLNQHLHSNERDRAHVPVFQRTAAYEIYRELLAPVDELIGTSTVLMSATGPLEEFPFSVLVVDRPGGQDGNASWQGGGATTWAVQVHAFVHLLSVSDLEMPKSFDTPRRHQLVAFGDPAFPVRTLGAVTTRSACTASPLAYAGVEIAALAKTYAESSPTTITGADATKESFLKLDLSSVKILEIATHAVRAGECGVNSPTGLIFSSSAGKAAVSEQNLLSTSESATLHLGVDIVALSACNTSSPDHEGEEPLSGLVQSFLFAGARSVLATRWNVNDAVAANLVANTLADTHLKSPAELSRNLQAFMARMVLSGTLEETDPRSWGPFVIVE